MTNINNSFVVKVNNKSQTFNPKFSKIDKQISPKVSPKANSVEEIYYDEIVIYDGGGVEGYGND